ncbi:GTPase HflX [Candidatus Poriferisodalis sp.]|uniref:GTPase HflX n=1 Tax=Candidatus Poriferisodalis sp. TaxID=3101277 RepID=UPI003B01D53B
MGSSEQHAAGQRGSGARSHRGAFGEFGGAESGLIDRAFTEQIVLVGMLSADRTADEVDANLDELERLVDTAGANPVDRIVQRRDAPDPATFIGRGKASEILDVSMAHDADTVVFDDELTPAQQYNLERLLKRTALDRTAVILDIFAQNATTLEGKAQVELAQLRYRLPRLRGRGRQLSQQAGGIGTRGPGETKLEVDRRRIQRRLTRLERDLRGLRRTRLNQRKSRRRSRYRTVAIVGYTNAGKSTLLRRLTGANVLIEDRLFATLDATTRRLQLPGGETVLVTDTVGFIKKLPTSLVEAFMSTLEEVAEADLLVHLVDASAAEPEMHIDVVRSVLREIGAGGVEELIAFNKCDAADERLVHRLLGAYEGAHAISSDTGDGVVELLLAVGDRLRRRTEVTELRIPYARGDALAAVHREGEVLSESHDDRGTVVHARLDEVARSLFAEFETAADNRSTAAEAAHSSRQ